MVRINADEKLFDDCRSIAQSISLLGSIVQNDIEIDFQDWNEWTKLASDVTNALDIWIYSVMRHAEFEECGQPQ